MRLKLWNMKPIFSLRIREICASESPATSVPSRVYEPVSKPSSRPAMLRKVVFPEPDGPMTETNSPLSTSRLKSHSACVSICSVR